MKKTYTENDEIELRLTHNVSTYYWLEWRYKAPKWTFLWFKKRDRWKTIAHYLPGFFTPDKDPGDEFNWYWHDFNLGKRGDVQEYERLKGKVKTKKQLYDYYHVADNIELYYQHLEQHKEWLAETNSTIKRLTK